MLYTGNKYYYLGQIASDEITGINNEKLLKQRTDSLSLHNESNSSVIGINAASDTDTEIMKFILSGDMPFMWIISITRITACVQKKSLKRIQ